jgi:hypothetical protein
MQHPDLLLQHPYKTLAAYFWNIKNSWNMCLQHALSAQHLLVAWENGGSSTCGVHQRQRRGSTCKWRANDDDCATWRGGSSHTTGHVDSQASWLRGSYALRLTGPVAECCALEAAGKWIGASEVVDEYFFRNGRADRMGSLGWRRGPTNIASGLTDARFPALLFDFRFSQRTFQMMNQNHFMRSFGW